VKLKTELYGTLYRGQRKWVRKSVEVPESETPVIIIIVIITVMAVYVSINICEQCEQDEQHQHYFLHAFLSPSDRSTAVPARK
jgi:hypothetical protein